MRSTLFMLTSSSVICLTAQFMMPVGAAAVQAVQPSHKAVQTIHMWYSQR